MTTPLISRVQAFINSFFQLGGLTGPGFNANGAALEARNATNSAYAVMRGAAPVADNDLATKGYVDTIFKPIPVSLQFNGGSALPANTSTEQWYVVTTSGANATIGQVLWDDGSNSGTVTVLPAKAGNEIVTTTAFSGGTISLSASQNYVWTGTAWQNISPNISGATFCIRIPITNAAAQSSATSLPTNAIVSRCDLEIDTPYSAGATISLGQTGSVALFQATTDNTPGVAGLYLADQSTAASNLPLLVTVGGGPAAGGRVEDELALAVGDHVVDVGPALGEFGDPPAGHAGPHGPASGHHGLKNSRRACRGAPCAAPRRAR